MPDPYVLPGTEILKNKFNLATQQDLDDAEADFVSLRLRELARDPARLSYEVQHPKKGETTQLNSCIM